MTRSIDDFVVLHETFGVNRAKIVWIINLQKIPTLDPKEGLMFRIPDRIVIPSSENLDGIGMAEFIKQFNLDDFCFVPRSHAWELSSEVCQTPFHDPTGPLFHR